MADNADAPAVKDLPKLGDHIKDEIVKDVQLKHIEVRTQSLNFKLGLPNLTMILNLSCS